MKTFIGFGLIILGLVSLSRYPNLGRDFAETMGALFGVSLLTFLPGYLLIRSDSKNKTNSYER
ncbi:hypothetical protein [Aquirufa sp. OSTEICH-129A]